MATATKTEVIAALSVELAKPDYVTLPVTGKGSKTSLLLTKPEISNPDPAPQVQAPADPAALFNPVPADELAAIDDGLLGRVMDAVEDGNLQRVSLQIQVAVARGYISSGTATALATACRRPSMIRIIQQLCSVRLRGKRFLRITTGLLSRACHQQAACQRRGSRRQHSNGTVNITESGYVVCEQFPVGFGRRQCHV